MISLSRLFAAALALSSGLALAQEPAAPPRRIGLDFTSLPRPAVPADPLEIVTAAQTVQDVQQRSDALALLRNAAALSNVRAQPYDLKTSFTSFGSLPSDGTWNLEDASRGSIYRWTAQGPNYSAIRLFPQTTQGAMYSNQPDNTLPLRLLEARDAIWFVYPSPGPQASLRTATAFLNGQEQRCVLVVIGAGSRTFSGARNWEESEYCMDANTGLLSMYSPAPGFYVRYDYSSAAKFHGKTIPGAFTITQAGRAVIEAKTLSVSEPPETKDPMFSVQGLTALGVGRAAQPHMNLHLPLPVPGQLFPRSNDEAVVQMVVVHGGLSNIGRLSEAEILASTDSNLNQAALEQAASLGLPGARDQPGATAQSGQAFFTFEFVARRQ